MNPYQLQVKTRLNKLNRALSGFSAGNRDVLFQSRDLLREATTSVSEGAWKNLSPICAAISRIVDEVLRHGGLDSEKSIELATELVAFVEKSFSQPAPGLTQDGEGKNGPRPVLSQTRFHLQNPPQPEPEPSAEEPAPAEPTREARPTQQAVSISYDLVNESRLGKILLRTGKIDSEQLERALLLQKLKPDRLGTVLIGMGVVDEEALREALEDQRFATLQLADTLSGTEPVPGHPNDEAHEDVPPAPLSLDDLPEIP